MLARWIPAVRSSVPRPERRTTPKEWAQRASRPVLFAADLFHPIDGASVQRLLDGDMRHRGRRRRTVPMLLTGRKPDNIARPDFLPRAAPTLHPSEPGGDNQRLAERMRMPGGAGSRLECNACDANTS